MFSPSALLACIESLVPRTSAELCVAFSGGLDSTVIDCSVDPVRILREGAIDRQTVARILGLSEIAVLRSVRR